MDLLTVLCKKYYVCSSRAFMVKITKEFFQSCITNITVLVKSSLNALLSQGVISRM